MGGANTGGTTTGGTDAGGTDTGGTTTGGTDTGGTTTGGTDAGGTDTGGTTTGGNGTGGNGTGGNGTGGNGGEREACDCSTIDCRPAPEVATDLCSSAGVDVWVTYTEREGCDYVEVGYEYNRGWRAYFYDDQATLVAFALDNAFGGSVQCGVETSCTGSILRACLLCGDEPLVDGELADCPATLWETVFGDDP